MFHFFHRGREFVRFVIDGSREAGYSITISEPNGAERIESFATSDAAYARWVELQQQYVAAGWWGPHGRE